MLDYTKGKWERQGNRIEVRGSGVVAKCPSPSDGGVMDFMANANLIAAAPKLYEALQEMLHIFSRDLPALSIGDLTCDKAKEALAKAEEK